eukprot:4630732-Prymnesium_polylepis.1
MPACSAEARREQLALSRLEAAALPACGAREACRVEHTKDDRVARRGGGGNVERCGRADALVQGERRVPRLDE